ncbi:hypothetical protein FNF27_04074 [Cafeteria roenbergensis]|uniref:Uncharacterized protein n=1 Tax=Cafeteria roenbergensis TaxID=33653 RepID=A0A5A8EB54_CAFRO|nr:hypothetical protein FNF27_04074 [Cafeteria roenbergensis]
MSAVVSIAGEPVLGSPSTLSIRELATWSDFDLAIVGPALSGMSAATETSWQGVGFALVHLDSDFKPSQQLPTDDAWVCIEAFRAPTAPSLVANGHLAAYTVGLLDLIDTPAGKFTVQTYVIDGSGQGSPDCATSPVLARGPPFTIALSMVPFSPSQSSIGRTASSAIRRGDTVELQLTLRDNENQVVEIAELAGKMHLECGDFATALGRAAATSACIVDKSTIQVHADKAITVSFQVLSSGPISVFAYVLGALVSGAPLDIHVEPAVFSTSASFATDAELSDAGPRRLSDVLPSGSILIAHEATSFELRAMKFTQRTEWPAETQFRVRTSGEAAAACQVTMPSSVGGEPLVSINCSRVGSLKLEFDVQVGGPPAGWELLDTLDPVVVDGWPAHAAISPPANVVNGFCRIVSVTWRLPSLEKYSAGLPRWLMYFAGAHVTKRWCDAPSGGSCFEAGMEATERAWLLPSSGAAGAVETQACAFGPNLAGKDVWLELRLTASNFTHVLPPVLVRASEPTRIRAQPLPFPPNTRAVFFSADPAAAAISCGPSVWGNSTSAPASCARLPDGAPGTAVAALQLRDRLGNQLEVLSAREIVRMGQVKAFAKVDPAADAVPLQVAACNSSLSNSTWPGLDAACQRGASVAVLWPASLGASDAIITATVMGRLVSLRGDGRLWQRTAILREATSERSVLMRPASEPTVAAGELFWVQLVPRDLLGLPALLPVISSDGLRLEAAFARISDNSGHNGFAATASLECASVALAAQGANCGAWLSAPMSGGRFRLAEAALVETDGRVALALPHGFGAPPLAASSPADAQQVDLLVAGRRQDLGGSVGLQLGFIGVWSPLRPARGEHCTESHSAGNLLQLPAAEPVVYAVFNASAGGALVSAWSEPARREAALSMASLARTDASLGCQALPATPTECRWRLQASHGLSEPPGGVVECSIPIGACPAGHTSEVLIRAPVASLLGHATCSLSAVTAAAARPAASLRVSWLDVNASLVSFQSGSTRAVSVEAGTLTDEAASIVLLSDDGLLAVARAPLDAVARVSSNPLLPTCTWCPRLPPADALTLATIAHRDGGEAALRLQPRIPGVFDVVVGFARAPPSPNASHQLFPSPEWARLRVEPIVNGTFSVVASLPRCALSSSGVSVAGPASVPGARIVLGDELSFTVRVASVLEAGAATDVLGCRLEDAGPFDRIDLASAAAIQLQAINEAGSWVTLNTSDVHVETRLPGSVFEVSARTCNALACLERLVGVKAGAAVRIVLSSKTTAVALAAKPLGATLVLPPSLSHSVKLLSVGESELAPQARPGLTQLLRMRVRDSSGAPFACGGESVLSDVRVTATGRQSMLPQCRSSAPSQKGCAGPAVLARCAVDANGQTSAEVWFPLAAGPDDDALRVEVSSAMLNQSAWASLSVTPLLIRAGAAFAGVASASAVRLTVVNGTVPAAGELAQVALHADALCEGDAAAQPGDPWIKALALSALAPKAWACTATSQADGLVLPVEVLDVAGPAGNECVRGHSLALMRMPSLAQAYSLSCAVGGVNLEHVEPIIVSAGVASADHSFVDGFSALWQDLSSHSSPRLALTVRDRFGNPAFLTGSEALAAAVFVGAERSAIAVAVSSGAAGAVTLTLNSSAALPALTSTSSPLWNAELRVTIHGNVSIAAVPLVSGPPVTFAGAGKEQPGSRAGDTTVFQIHALSAAGPALE